MKKIIIATALTTLVFAVLFSFAYDRIRFFNKSGEITRGMRIYTDTVVCTSATQTVSYASAGFSKIASVSIMAERNTSNAYDVPQASIKSWTNSAAVVNITQGSNTLVSVLGLNVLQGPSTTFVTTPSSVTLHLQIVGY